MSYKHFSTSNICNVRAIIAVQPLNGLPGFAARTSKGAYAAQSGFFMHKAQLHPNNGGACGGTERFAGFLLLTGTANPVRLTTPSFAATGSDSKILKGVQP